MISYIHHFDFQILIRYFFSPTIQGMLRLFAVFRLTTFSSKVSGFIVAMRQAVFVMLGMVVVFSFIFYIFTLTMMQMSVRYKLQDECFAGKLKA